MTDNSNASSGSNGDSSGEADETQKPKVVPRETYDKVLKEKRNRDAEAAALKQKLAEYEAAEAKRAEEEAAKRGDFETTLKTLKEQIAERDRKLSEASEKEVRRTKVAAFIKAFGAPFPEKYGQLVNIDSIELDADGKADMQSASLLVENFKKEFPEIIPKKVGIPTPNPNGSGGKGSLTPEEWLALPYKQQKERLKDVVKTTK